MAIENRPSYSGAVDVIPQGSYYEFLAMGHEFGVRARIIATEGQVIVIDQKETKSNLRIMVAEGELGIVFFSINHDLPAEDHPFWEKVTDLKFKVMGLEKGESKISEGRIICLN